MRLRRVIHYNDGRICLSMDFCQCSQAWCHFSEPFFRHDYIAYSQISIRERKLACFEGPYHDIHASRPNLTIDTGIALLQDEIEVRLQSVNARWKVFWIRQPQGPDEVGQTCAVGFWSLVIVM